MTAHSEVKRACDLLVAASPEALETCQNALRSALSELTEFRLQCPQTVGPGTRSAAYRLRAEVLRAARLLQSLSGFYRGWERILGAMSAGYTASGEPAPVARPGRLCYRG